MRIRRVGKQNATVVSTPEVEILFSYETPVAVRQGHRFFRTSQFHSKTTSKHINQWLDECGANEVETMPQSKLNELTAAVA